VIDGLREVEGWLEWLSFLAWLVAAVGLGGFFLGRHVPIRIAIAIFGVGTAILAFLAYRLYQSQVDYCKDSPEVSAGGDKFSCLEPQHWFANALALSFFLLIELGLATTLAVGFVRWRKQRRL
jgi:hypothetical protein